MNAETRELTDLFATSSLGAPEKAVGFVLWRVLHRYVREIDHALASLDLTHLQFTTLTMAAWLARSGEPVTQAALARHGDISTMQVSHMLKALEGKAMVTRPRSEKDVRSKEIRVTTTGVAVLREALPVAIEVQRRLFGAGDELLTRLLEVEEAGDRRR